MKKTLLSLAGILAFSLLAFFLLAPVVGNVIAAFFAGGTALVSFLPMEANILGLNNTNNFTARESFNHAKRMFWRAFRDKFAGFNSPNAADVMKGDKDCQDFVDSLKLSQSEIRLEVELNATTNLYSFGVTPNQVNTNNIQFPTERRLVLQDSICVNEYAIFVAKPTSRTDTEFILRSYGNTQDFSAAAAAALDGGFYSNGTTIIKCNNDVIMPYRGLLNNWYAAQTQQTAALGAASPKDQIRGAEDASVTDEPNIVIIGSKNYVPQIELKNNLSTVDEFSRVIWILRGVYAQNSTVVS